MRWWVCCSSTTCCAGARSAWPVSACRKLPARRGSAMTHEYACDACGEVILVQEQDGRRLPPCPLCGGFLVEPPVVAPVAAPPATPPPLPVTLEPVVEDEPAPPVRRTREVRKRRAPQSPLQFPVYVRDP